MISTSSPSASPRSAPASCCAAIRIRRTSAARSTRSSPSRGTGSPPPGSERRCATPEDRRVRPTSSSATCPRPLPLWRERGADDRGAEPLVPRPPERRPRVVEGHLAAQVVVQREPVAGGLRRALPSEALVQEPVHPLVAVEEADDVARRTEAHALGEPHEPEALRRHPFRTVVDAVAERKERLREPDDDRALLVVGLGREVRVAPVPERFERDRVPLRFRKARDHLAERLGRVSRVPGDELHGAERQSAARYNAT